MNLAYYVLYVVCYKAYYTLYVCYKAHAMKHTNTLYIDLRYVRMNVWLMFPLLENPSAHSRVQLLADRFCFRIVLRT